MKAFLIALVALAPTALNAASLEQDYYAARDRAIKHMAAADKPGGYDDKLREYEDKALADLTARMRRIVGPSRLPGMSGEGTSNVDTLYRGDQGFGRLDGLAYGEIDAKTRVVVSTDTLFKAWLKSRRKWWPTDEVPQDMTKALRSDAFFTQALLGDAAFQIYAELPVTKPAKASTVFAMLNTRAQDIGPWPATEITVSLVQGHRVYVVTTPAETSIAPMPECVALWDAANKKLQEESEKPPVPGQSFGDLSESVRSNGDEEFHRCFAERAPRDPGYAALVKQAQAIVDGLPADQATPAARK
jgi:hypothetical protein